MAERKQNLLIVGDNVYNLIDREARDQVEALDTEIRNITQDVRDGKASLAEAITSKGIETTATDTFAQMTQNIYDIKTGGATPIGDGFRIIKGNADPFENTKYNYPVIHYDGGYYGFTPSSQTYVCVTPDGSIPIVISGYSHNKPQKWAIITRIKNNGLGYDTENFHRKYIFGGGNYQDNGEPFGFVFADKNKIQVKWTGALQGEEYASAHNEDIILQSGFIAGPSDDIYVRFIYEYTTEGVMKLDIAHANAEDGLPGNWTNVWTKFSTIVTGFNSYDNTHCFLCFLSCGSDQINWDSSSECFTGLDLDLSQTAFVVEEGVTKQMEVVWGASSVYHMTQ